MLVSAGKHRSSRVFMQINCNMRIEVVEDFLKIARLLSAKFHMVAVGIEIRSQVTLEISDTIWRVARKDSDVHLVKDGRGPGRISVHFA